MNKTAKRAVATLGLTAILGTSVFTGATAAGTDIKGKIMKMNIFNNGAAITIPQDQQPIIVNNRTYLPVRALGEALGQQVDWYANDPNNIYISGGQDQGTLNQMAIELNQAKLQIIDKDKKISDLEKQVKDLENKVEEEKEKGLSLSELEKDLNREYGRYKYVDLSIQLSGNENKVRVKVDISKNYRTDWDDLTSAEREKLVEYIVYDIQREYKKASVEGYVESGYSSTSMDFYTDNRDKLIIKGGSGSSSSGLTIQEVEDRIYRKFSDWISDVKISETNSYIDIDITTKYYLISSEKNKIEDFAKEEARYELSTNKTISVYFDN